MIGKTISHYKILEKLGGGGMGVVYKAEDTKLKRTVALKFLPQDLTRDEEAKKRFMHEAQAASALDHPNIGTIHEVDQTDDGQMFIVMVYYEGETLKAKIEHGPQPIQESIDIALQIAQGLAKAHGKGIVHRDIKPANIMMTTDNVIKIVDFGLAKLAGRTKLTKEDSTLGTVAYMSPEQAQGVEVDHRSDIFSLGVVLYEMLTGESPFKGDYEQAVVYSILHEDPEPITEFLRDVPIKLEGIVNKTMAKSAQERYQNIEDLAIDLRLVKNESAAKDGSNGLAAKLTKRPTVMAGVGGLLILLSVAGFYLWQNLTQTDTDLAGLETEAELFERIRKLPKIAVLYLENLSDDREQDFFAAGMTEDIITELSNIKNLRVLSRQEVLPYREKKISILEIGDELDVSYVVQGAVRRQMNQLRVTVQLTKVEDGVHLWAHKFDRDLEDVFKVQDEIATSVANALDVKLSRQEEQIVEKIPTTNMSAYDFYLRGQHFWEERTRADNLQAEQMFRQAITLDDNYALAYIGLADVFIQRPDWGWDEDPKWIEEAKILLDKASAIDSSVVELYLSLGSYYSKAGEESKCIAALTQAVAMRPNDYYTHYLLGVVGFFYDRRWAEAKQEFQISLQLRANYSEPYRWLARLARRDGKPMEGIRYIEKAVELSPEAGRMHLQAGNQHKRVGNFTKAASYYEAAARLRPSSKSSIANLGWVELFQRKLPEAIRHLEMLPFIRGGNGEYLLGQAYLLAGEQMKAEEHFRDLLRAKEKSSELLNRHGTVLLKCLLGRIKDPQPALDELSKIPPPDSEDPSERSYHIAMIHASVGNTDEAIDVLEEVVKFNIWSPKYIAADPFFDSLKNDSRFVELVNEPWPVVTSK